MDYLKINGNRIPFCNGFTMTQVPNIVNEVTLMNGNVQADINGWKYADTTLKWEMLHEDDLTTLLSGTDPIRGTFELSFYEPGSNAYKTVKALRKGRVVVKTRYKEAGKILWKGIEIELTFPESYGSN